MWWFNITSNPQLLSFVYNDNTVMMILKGIGTPSPPLSFGALPVCDVTVPCVPDCHLEKTPPDLLGWHNAGERLKEFLNNDTGLASYCWAWDNGFSLYFATKTHLQAPRPSPRKTSATLAKSGAWAYNSCHCCRSSFVYTVQCTKSISAFMICLWESPINIWNMHRNM